MLNKAKLIKESKIIAISLALGGLIALAAATSTYIYSMATQQEIAENVIRFHVLANSNSATDQQLKEKVRVGLLAEFEAYLSTTQDINTTRQLLASKLPDMQAFAGKIIGLEGAAYPARAYMGQVFFPTRFYGNMAFPPGNYEAVQIIIGDGQGSNWWCLMFPPLCFIDATSTDEGAIYLAENLTEEGFRLIMHQEYQDPTVAVRFKVVEWWQNRRAPQPQPIPFETAEEQNTLAVSR
ncbi:MAG: stage II sporulation protein R [Defluviitaleaceae bacterium]|nr:stage II sporulation protein R [Defluviitaleaceae bacterium]